jgi:hypothetical protein
LLDAVTSGELHLTGLLMLGPHLTAENFAEVMARAKHRTKKEIARLVRVLDPVPAVPARIEPLGPAPARLVPKTPTWSEFVESLCPVRELQPGERPRDWVEADTDPASDCHETSDSAPARPEQSASTPHDARGDSAPARLEPQRYSVQFTASEEYVKLVVEAQALLSHSNPGISLDDLHLRAMRALVGELKRKKYAVPPRSHGRPAAHEPPPTDVAVEAPRQPRQRGSQGRHVPAAVRRAVYERDGGSAAIRLGRGSAVQRRTVWSCTTSDRLLAMARTRPKTSRCAVERTTRLPLSRTLVATSSVTLRTLRGTNGGRPESPLSRKSTRGD